MRNFDEHAAAQFVEEAERDRSLLKRTMQVTVRWNADESKPQMAATAEFHAGAALLECDQPPFQGGRGRAPNPLQHCLFGLATCFAGTLASVIAKRNLEVDAMTVTAVNKVNLARPLGMSDEPSVEGVELAVEIESAGSQDEPEECKQLAVARCPGVYCVTKAIPLAARLHVLQREAR